MESRLIRRFPAAIPLLVTIWALTAPSAVAARVLLDEIPHPAIPPVNDSAAPALVAPPAADPPPPPLLSPPVGVSAGEVNGSKVDQGNTSTGVPVTDASQPTPNLPPPPSPPPPSLPPPSLPPPSPPPPSPPPPSPPPPSLPKEEEQIGDGKDKEEATDQPGEVPKGESAVTKICNGSIDRCQVGEEFIGCLWSSASDSFYMLLENKGETTLSIRVEQTSNINLDLKEIEIPKHGSKKVEIHGGSLNNGDVTLHAPKGNCILHISVPSADWQQQFEQFTIYATHLNPIYGIYFSVGAIVLVGGVWACCKFSRRRRVDGEPQYQQLEMGSQAHAAADVPVASADGWEEGWDDGEWDDVEAAVEKPPDRVATGGAPTNGISLRSTNVNRDGWDVEWDE